MNKIVLVCSWDGSRWNFPRGKIEEGEDAFECSIREVEEETGYNPRGNISQQRKIEYQQGSKTVTLFIGTNVPENTVFAPKTRKEISKVQFFSLDDLPKNFYNAALALTELKKWIRTTRKMGNTPKRARKNKQERSESAEFDERNVETFPAMGQGWSVDEMFAANVAITGKQFDYDGNPHSFGDSHPRYVEYSNHADKILSLSNHESMKQFEVLEPGRFFPIEFKFDVSRILLDMDRVLVRCVAD